MVAFTALEAINMNDLSELGQLEDGFDNPALDPLDHGDTSVRVNGTSGLIFLFTGDIKGVGDNIKDNSILDGMRVFFDAFDDEHDQYVITNFSLRADQVQQLAEIETFLDGNDSVNGSADNDTLRGFLGDDKVRGKAGSDKLFGDDGNDTVFGGFGADDMTGGKGKDKFVLDDEINGSDEIKDFNTTLDLIHLSRELFAGIGKIGEELAASRFKIGNNATTSKHRIIYDQDATSNRGFLYYDSNGNESGGKVKICELDDGLSLTAADFIVVA